jgi:hypothetical protein
MTLKFYIRFTFDTIERPSGEPYISDLEAWQQWLDEFVSACMNELPQDVSYRFLHSYKREAIVQFLSQSPVSDPVSLIQTSLYDAGILSGRFEPMTALRITALVPTDSVADTLRGAVQEGRKVFLTSDTKL